MSDYKRLEELVAISERAGGYAHITGAEGDFFEIPTGNGERAQVGPGRDVVTFLQIALRRSQGREAELTGNADPGYDNGALAQQLRDGRREVVRAVEKVLRGMET